MTTHNHDVLMAINSRIINGRSGGAKQLNADYKALVKARDEILKLREALAEQPAQQEPVAWVDGATHYQPNQKAFYKRVSATEWYVWSRVEQEPLHWCKALGTSDSAHWILRQPAQQQEPKTKDVVIANMGKPFTVKAYVDPQPAQQEPVAWIEGMEIYWHNAPDLNDWIRQNGQPLYTTPPAQQHGWKLVPLEPTQEMIDAVPTKPHPTRPNGWGDRNVAIYKAMIVAAPQPSETGVTNEPHPHT